MIFYFGDSKADGAVTGARCSPGTDIAKRLIVRADSHDRMTGGGGQHLGFYSAWDAQLMRDAAEALQAPPSSAGSASLREKVARAMWERTHDEPWEESHHSPVAREIYWDDAGAAVEVLGGVAQPPSDL